MDVDFVHRLNVNNTSIFISVDATFQPWGPWGACEQACVSQDDIERNRLPEQIRNRTCGPEVNSGKECPDKRKYFNAYREYRNCPDIPKCPSMYLLILCLQK